ncbi:hypothetical protein AVEN_213652-1 [Araneus ventricosus]|uniref:Uncharacterized protein n=1 Tax=Araneus ventricosus TaxID=182803 RepID=A0A4Y2HGY0_ARAVE|nr:hypothetical protein AVEN_87703-1 [Araneus ventricosus]GBM64324.1 hypothetical protein AVEN_213652-1 [Araneus ventricosus]
MQLNAITDYVRLVVCALPYRTVARWVKAFRAGRNEAADLHRTGRKSIPQHQIDIVSDLLSIDHLWTVRESSVEVGFSHQTMWYLLKKWRMLGRSVAVINNQHFANGILRLPDIWQKVSNFADDYIEGK